MPITRLVITNLSFNYFLPANEPITIKIWGAGGSGAAGGGNGPSYGGGGGYAELNFTLTSPQNVTFYVGRGGTGVAGGLSLVTDGSGGNGASGYWSGGGGGGASAFIGGSYSIIVPGGGGAGGDGSTARGAGGGGTGNGNGGAAGSGGTAGTPSVGGTGGGGGGSNADNGSPTGEGGEGGTFVNSLAGGPFTLTTTAVGYPGDASGGYAGLPGNSTDDELLTYTTAGRGSYSNTAAGNGLIIVLIGTASTTTSTTSTSTTQPPTTTSTSTTTTYAYARVYNPSLRIENYTVSSKTFDIDEFVDGWVENPTFNSTFATAATYKNTAANILPIYQSNVAYSATAGTRYGLYRTPDSSGLAYWTNYCLVNGYNINTTAFRDAFFTAADSITTGVLANRHITQANVFLTLQNEYAETTVPKETDLYLEILSGPVYLPVTGEVQLPDGRSRQFAASLNQFGYARIPVPVKVDPSVTNGSSIFYTVNFPTPFVSNTTYRFLEAKISSPINNKKFIARLRQGGPSGNILANSQIVTITGAGISAFSGADMANIITANSIVFGNADNVGTKSANILTTTPGRYQAGSKQFIVRVRRGSFSGPIVANSQIINVMNLGYGTFTANDILGFTRIKALTSDTGMGAVYQRMSNVGYTPTPTTTSTSTSTSTTSTSTSTSTTSTSTSTSTTSTSTSTTTSSSTTTTTVPPPSTTTSTSTTSTSTTTTSTSTTTTSTSTTTSTTNAGNWTITHGQATNGYIIGDTIVVTVESDFANALFYVTVAGAGTVTPVSQGPLYTNSTPTTPGGTRYSGSTSFLTTGLGSIVVELRLSTISAPVRASIGLNIIVITSTSTSTSTTSTTTLVPLPTSTTTTSTSTTSTTTSAAPFSPTTTSSTTTTTTTTLAPTYILLSAPVIAGTAAVGTDITMTSDAAWDPAGASTGSMWQRSPALPPSDVWTNTGDVDNTYTITSADIGYYFRLRRRSPDGVLTAYSNTIGPGGYYTTTTSTTSTSTSTSTTSTTTGGPPTTTTSTTSTTTTLAPAQTLLFLDSANTSSYNPATPGTWVDLSGNNRSANISPTSNNISYTSTVGTGLGLNFSRTQGTDFFTGNNSSALGAITGDITVEVWFSLRNPPITTHDLIALGSPGAYTFALRYTGTQLSFTRGTTSVSINHNITLSSYASPNWYQVVGVSTNGLLKLYFNGVEMDTTGTPGATYPATAGSEYNISNSTGLHDGKISIVRVFDRALTSPEVYATYNSYKTRHGLS